MKAVNADGKVVEIQDVNGKIPPSKLHPKKRETGAKKPYCEICGASKETLFKREDVWLCKPCLTKFELLMKIFGGIVNGEEL